MDFAFAYFLYKGSFGHIWIKTTERPIRPKNLHFGAHSQIIVLRFVHF